jgi:hypothetical protein
MRKLILLFLVCWLPAYCAALNGTVGWNVSNNANGNSANGGGFDAGVTSPGTNASYSNPVSFSDLICVGTTCTSITLAFSASSVGNLVNVTSGAGCTTGRHEILSQSLGTATFNDSLGTGTCTGKYGGALDTWANAETAAAVAGQIVWYQCTGTNYTITSGIAAAGTAEHTVWGYQTTWGDNGCQPITASSTASMTFYTVQANASVTLNNIALLGSGSFNGIGVVMGSTGGLIVRNCTLTANSNTNTSAIDAYNSQTSILVENTEIKNWGYGFFMPAGGSLGNRVFVLNSYIHGSSVAGIGDDNLNGSYPIYWYSIGSVWDSNNYAFYQQTTTSYPVNIIIQRSVISNSTHDGLNVAAGHVNNANMTEIADSILYGNGGYGATQPGCFSGPQGAYGETLYNNGIGGNNGGGTGLTYNCLTSSNDVALSVNPFVSSSNFALNSTAGGGAALKAAGFPGVTPMGTGYLDIGALQSQAAAGASIAAGGYVQ